MLCLGADGPLSAKDYKKLKGLYTSVALVPMDSSGYSQPIVTLVLVSHTAGTHDRNMGVIKVGNEDMHNAIDMKHNVRKTATM